MVKPEIPIQVDPATGVWSTDGLPMIYMPRHFFVNNHLAVEAALGEAVYARQLYDAGHKSAWVWCETEAATHGLEGLEVFHRNCPGSRWPSGWIGRTGRFCRFDGLNA